MPISPDHIRNFCIIAHIDHGKSTLADRMLELTDSVAKRDMEDQILDNMDLERERGITIKAHAVTIDYTAKNGEKYELNLIDTPGHVDFNYEVSRSLAACEGAVLVVDASQGIEAQTLANTYLAVDNNLEVIPVINKIDLPSAEPDRVIKDIEDIIGIPAEGAAKISAKTGLNIDQVMENIVNDIPAPVCDRDAPLQALIFDSYYDAYKGVIVYFRVKSGVIRTGDTIKMMATGATFDVVEVGRKKATSMEPCDALYAGEVGYLAAAIKNVGDARVGDTITSADRPAAEPLEGYRKINPVVFCGIYPADGAHYTDLREALEKLQLNDASLEFEPETSVALGFGFRCGFLGLLHMEIIQERLEREYNLDLITTAPSVIYRLTLSSGENVALEAGGRRMLVEQDGTRLEIAGEELAYHKVEAEQEIPMTNTVTVPRGKEFSLRLSDGTQVWLNSESSLVFPVRFGDGPREVTVTGEAYFDVAHDASRRFVVHADTVSVSVYGTAFNISSYADEGAIETTLVRGSVEVRSGHRRAMLQPGQQARVGREGAIFDVRQVAAEDYAAWTRGLFTFNDETIASICRKLSRWYGVEIVPRGVDADKVRYTGVVKRYETFAEMARLLARTDQIRADVEEGKIVLCIDRDDD